MVHDQGSIEKTTLTYIKSNQCHTSMVHKDRKQKKNGIKNEKKILLPQTLKCFQTFGKNLLIILS